MGKVTSYIEQSTEHPVLLFDGSCGLCNASVRFVLKHEKTNVLRFASLSSDFAKDILQPHFPLSHHIPDSIILIYKGKPFLKSDAIFQIARLMGGWVKIVLPFRFLPTAWLDCLYDFVAANRKRLFPAQSYCGLNSGLDRSRFLDLK